MDYKDAAGTLSASLATALAVAVFVLSPQGQLEAHPNAAQTSPEALEFLTLGSVVQWTEPKTGISVEIAPQTAYLANDGRWCRPYVMTIAHQPEQKLACRSDDGVWTDVPAHQQASMIGSQVALLGSINPTED